MLKKHDAMQITYAVQYNQQCREREGSSKSRTVEMGRLCKRLIFKRGRESTVERYQTVSGNLLEVESNNKNISTMEDNKYSVFHNPMIGT